MRFTRTQLSTVGQLSIRSLAMMKVVDCSTITPEEHLKTLRKEETLPPDPRLTWIRKRKKNDLCGVIFGHASREVKLHAVYAKLYVGLSLKAIAVAFGKSPQTISTWVQRYLATGDVLRKIQPRNSRKIFIEHQTWILKYVNQFPLSHLSEIRDAFASRFFHVCISTIYHVLVQNKYTKKVIEARALEIQQSEVVRFTLEVNIVCPLPFQLLFLDEMSVDSRSMKRKRGWFQRGSVPYCRQSFTRSERLSVLSFLGVEGLLDSFLIESTFTRAIFFACIKEFLQKNVVSPYPGLHSVWIMDGASIHMDENIVEFLFTVGVVVIYLPPYCPFYNPIEIVFGLVKGALKKFYERKGTERLLLTTVLDNFSSRDFESIFQKCGYGLNGLFDPYKSFPTLQ